MGNDILNMAVGHPMQNAAQGSILGAYSNQGVVGERRIEHAFDYNRQLNINVINADNGFVVIMKPEMPGTTSRVLVASSIEELRDLITSEMVTRKMEK